MIDPAHNAIRNVSSEPNKSFHIYIWSPCVFVFPSNLFLGKCVPGLIDLFVINPLVSAEFVRHCGGKAGQWSSRALARSYCTALRWPFAHQVPGAACFL